MLLACVARVIHKIKMASKGKRSFGEEHQCKSKKKRDNIQQIILESVQELGYDTQNQNKKQQFHLLYQMKMFLFVYLWDLVNVCVSTAYH